MKRFRKPAFLTALAVTATSFAAMPSLTAYAANGAGGYTWVATSGYQEATTSVTDSDGKTTVAFTNAGDANPDTGNGGEYAGFCTENSDGWDWSEYTQLTFTVTNNCSAEINFGLALGTGSNWAWIQSNNTAGIAGGASATLSYYFKADEWSYDGEVCSVSNLYDVHRINMMVSSPYQASLITGSVVISDMSLGGSGSVVVEPKDGFYVDGTVLRDANGNPFIMRGTSYEYAWFTWDHDPADALKEMANYGANAVRIVLADGDKWSKISSGQVANLIEQCEKNKLIAVLEVHDATGNNNESAIINAANYFAEIANVLKGHEDTVIINIANEWMESTNDTAWQTGWTNAIKVVRNAGLTHCIMCDAGGYGQGSSTIINSGAAVLAADPENNCMFSIHMYSSAGKDAATIKGTIDAMAVRNLCLVVGEFAQKDDWGDVDEGYIMSYCEQTNTGWLAWSWYGNSSSYMDMVSANVGGTLSSDWGDVVVNGTYGWKKTAEICTVYTQTSGSTATSSSTTTTTTTTTLTSTTTTTTTTEDSYTFEVQKYPVELPAGDKTGMTLSMTFAGAAGASIGGAVGYGSNADDWTNLEWSGNADSDGNLMVEIDLSDVASGITSAEIQVWWSNVWNASSASSVDQPVEMTGYEITGGSEDTVVWGDADENGECQLADAVMLAKAVASIGELSVQGKVNCDVYADGKTDGSDLTIVLKLIAGSAKQADMPVTP